MITDNPAAYKLVTISTPIRLGDAFVFPIPPNKFTREEIEMLREEDDLRKQLGYQPFVANFLPDDIRPKGIPKM